MTMPKFTIIKHFNSHAHVERDLAVPDTFFKTPISTHTLTWSVTYWNLVPNNIESISTHTLTWSVTAVKSS